MEDGAEEANEEEQVWEENGDSYSVPGDCASLHGGVLWQVEAFQGQ